jgi:hypothetical protein
MKLATALACASSLMLATAHAQSPQRIGAVWYILLENRNFTEDETSGGQQIWGSAAAPYINSLVTPGNLNAAQVSYCQCYHNDMAVYNGAGASIHPSEPNYVWFECGSNLSKLDDNDPYGTAQSVLQIHNYLAANPALSGQNLSGLLQAASISWRSYTEGANQLNSATPATNANLGGNLTATAAPESAWTVPLASFSGSNASYTNPYNGSTQWNLACKHTGSLFFADTNGTTSLTVANTSTTNPEADNYSPLPNLENDLLNQTCAQFNVITPDQYNDMHTALSAGFTYHGTHYTGDSAQVAQGDNFLSIVVPEIMASQQYKDNGMIVIWTDETEGSNQNDFQHTLTEIVISPLAKGNAYASTLNYTHSSDLNTLQKIFQVTGNTNSGFLNDAANPSNPTPAALVGARTELGGGPSGYGTGTAYDLSDLFQPGVIPSTIPTTSITPGGYVLNRRNNTVTQTVTVTNYLSSAISTPVYLAVEGLSSNTSLVNKAGLTTVNSPGSPYVLVSGSGLTAGASASVTLQFAVPASGAITNSLDVLATATP